MTVDLTKNSVLNLINQNNDLKKELEKGKLFNYNHSIYFIQTIKNLNNDGNHIKFAIIAHSSLKAHKIFGQILYENEANKFIKGNQSPPSFEKIFNESSNKLNNNIDMSDLNKVDMSDLNKSQKELVNLFIKVPEVKTERSEVPEVAAAKGYSREQKAFALFVSVMFLSATAYGANKVRKGNITLPTRKEIGNFLSKTKSSPSEYLSQLRQKWMPQGVKA